jgi:hypothetical protein
MSAKEKTVKEISSVRTTASSITENLTSHDSDHETSHITTSYHSSADPVNFHTGRTLYGNSGSFGFISEINRQHNLLSELKLDPLTVSLMKSMRDPIERKYHSKN